MIDDTHMKGVNLGGWLVLEKWITPSLFHGMTAEDEYGWCIEKGDLKEQYLKKHRDTFITESDIAWIAEHGLQAIRLPIPYWLFGVEGPYVACDSYVIWLLDMAKKYKLQVLLDLHTALGSQNGNDHSGRSGAINWTTEQNITATLNLLSNIVERFGGHPATLGIELLNEPHSSIAHGVLLDYYVRAIDAIRRVHPHLSVVVSDAYRPLDWIGTSLGDIDNVYLDVHLYRVFSSEDKQLPVEQHLSRLQQEWSSMLGKLQRHIPVIVGEWSLGLDPNTLKHLNEEEQSSATAAFAEAQLRVFERASGWFFWTYKTEDYAGWSMRSAVSQGVLHI